jgi:hypothetical protein
MGPPLPHGGDECLVVARNGVPLPVPEKNRRSLSMSDGTAASLYLNTACFLARAAVRRAVSSTFASLFAVMSIPSSRQSASNQPSTCLTSNCGIAQTMGPILTSSP